MPTDPFQCQVLVWKAGFEQPVQCDFIVKERASTKDQQVTYQNHIDIHKMNGSFFLRSMSLSPIRFLFHIPALVKNLGPESSG